MKRLFKGIAPLLAEAMPDFIAITIKPKPSRKWCSLTPIQQQKCILLRVRDAVSRLPKSLISVIGYELHFEKFQNGGLHAHGAIYTSGVVKDSIWADQFQKDFIQHNSKLGSCCCLAKTPFGDDPWTTWNAYMNKSNVLPQIYSITPYGMSQQYRWDYTVVTTYPSVHKPVGCMRPRGGKDDV